MRIRLITDALLTLSVMIGLFGSAALPQIVHASGYTLPPYLSECVSGSSIVYHSHPNLTITVYGANLPLPVTYSPSCALPIHTHDVSGIIHIETDQNVNYTLGDFFRIWAYYENDTTFSIFNSTQLFNQTGIVSMTVNGQPSTQYANLIFPRNAAPSQGYCASPAPCQPFNINITVQPNPSRQDSNILGLPPPVFYGSIATAVLVISLTTFIFYGRRRRRINSSPLSMEIR